MHKPHSINRAGALRIRRACSGFSLLAGMVLPGTGLHAADSPKDFTPDQFDGPIYHETQGYVIAEAENLALSGRWQHRSDPGNPYSDGQDKINDPDPHNYRGTGYMRWVGPSQGLGHEHDTGPNHRYQGNHGDWMVVKVWCENPGTYKVDVRNYHLELDGDNDVWVSYLGQTSNIPRMADRVERGYTWVDWNNAQNVPLQAGLNGIVLAGRSRGFGIDRVAIFRGGNANIARNPDTPETALYGASTPPDITEGPQADPSTVTGTTTNLSVTATDPDGDPLTYSWSASVKPAGANPAIQPGEDPVVTFDKAGHYTFEVVVTDGLGGRTTGTVDVTVEATALGLSINPL